METKEKIKVYIDIQNGKTVCICKRNHKGCGKKCQMWWNETNLLAGRAPSTAIGLGSSHRPRCPRKVHDL